MDGLTVRYWQPLAGMEEVLARPSSWHDIDYVLGKDYIDYVLGKDYDRLRFEHEAVLAANKLLVERDAAFSTRIAQLEEQLADVTKDCHRLHDMAMQLKYPDVSDRAANDPLCKACFCRKSEHIWYTNACPPRTSVFTP